jgi:hypothetical protein
MILFSLRCTADHRFEGWFRDGAAYDRQSAAGEIACPDCGDTRVEKAPMAPRLAKRHPAPSPAQVRRALRELRHQVETSCDYVGERFAEEARRIHYGEVAARGIYGEASTDDAKSLADEGIAVARIPWIPREDA